MIGRIVEFQGSNGRTNRVKAYEDAQELLTQDRVDGDRGLSTRYIGDVYFGGHGLAEMQKAAGFMDGVVHHMAAQNPPIEVVNIKRLWHICLPKSAPQHAAKDDRRAYVKWHTYGKAEVVKHHTVLAITARREESYNALPSAPEAVALRKITGSMKKFGQVLAAMPDGDA